jgi:L-ascorbate metabolism protein UlaG (beta-lactamase superfamily)
MEIVWYGLSSFRLTERGNASIVTDPYPDEYGYTHPHPRADVVTVSCDDPTRSFAKAVRGPTRVLDGAGEYEIGGVFITGVAFANKTKRSAPAVQNRVFVFEYDHVTICHLGALNFVPSQSQVEALGTVNVLLTPVGGKDLLSSAEAAELVSLLEPNYVIPMHYHVQPAKLRLPKVDTFLNEMGLSRVQSEDSLKVISSSLPDETQVVLLRPAL